MKKLLLLVTLAAVQCVNAATAPQSGPSLTGNNVFTGSNTFSGNINGSANTAAFLNQSLGDSADFSGGARLTISQTTANIGKDAIKFYESTSSKAAYAQWNSATEFRLYYNDNAGYLTLAGGNVRVVSTVAANPAFVVKEASSHTGSAQEWQNSSGTVLLKIDKNGVLVFPTNTSAPSTITGSAQLWSQQVSGTAELKVMDGAGNITQLSPHARGSLPVAGVAIDDGSHEFPIIIHHQNLYVGAEEWVNISALAADLEKVTGKKYVFRRPLAQGATNWDTDQERQAAEWRAEAKRINDHVNARIIAGEPDAAAGLIRTNFVKIKKPDFIKIK